jgi:fatty acid desaturase
MTTGPGEKSAFWRSPAGLTFGVFLAVGALFLVLEHGAHLLGAWPLLLLLLCGGMHFFMHRGHGGHSSGEHEDHAKHRKEDDDGR